MEDLIEQTTSKLHKLVKKYQILKENKNDLDDIKLQIFIQVKIQIKEIINQKSDEHQDKYDTNINILKELIKQFDYGKDFGLSEDILIKLNNNELKEDDIVDITDCFLKETSNKQEKIILEELSKETELLKQHLKNSGSIQEMILTYLGKNIKSYEKVELLGVLYSFTKMMNEYPKTDNANMDNYKEYISILQDINNNKQDSLKKYCEFINHNSVRKIFKVNNNNSGDISSISFSGASNGVADNVAVMKLNGDRVKLKGAMITSMKKLKDEDNQALIHPIKSKIMETFINELNNGRLKGCEGRDVQLNRGYFSNKFIEKYMYENKKYEKDIYTKLAYLLDIQYMVLRGGSESNSREYYKPNDNLYKLEDFLKYKYNINNISEFLEKNVEDIIDIWGNTKKLKKSKESKRITPNDIYKTEEQTKSNKDSNDILKEYNPKYENEEEIGFLNGVDLDIVLINTGHDNDEMVLAGIINELTIGTLLEEDSGIREVTNVNGLNEFEFYKKNFHKFEEKFNSISLINVKNSDNFSHFNGQKTMNVIDLIIEKMSELDMKLLEKFVNSDENKNIFRSIVLYIVLKSLKNNGVIKTKQILEEIKRNDYSLVSRMFEDKVALEERNNVIEEQDNVIEEQDIELIELKYIKKQYNEMFEKIKKYNIKLSEVKKITNDIDFTRKITAYILGLEENEQNVILEYIKLDEEFVLDMLEVLKDFKLDKKELVSKLEEYKDAFANSNETKTKLNEETKSDIIEKIKGTKPTN